jgi:hypothetical protein
MPAKPKGCAGRRHLASGLVALGLVLAGCHTPAPSHEVALFQRLSPVQARPPSELDLAVADLAAAALAGSRPQMDDALTRVKSLHSSEYRRRARENDRPEMTGLIPLCSDLVNSTLRDPREYREAAEEILNSWSLDTDPALEARLKQAVADDPLALAGKRMRDHWETLFASTFNAVAEPLGKSLVWGVAIAPFNLASSLSHYAANLYLRPKISLQERQALAHRKQYVAQYPNSEDTPKLEKKIASAQARLDDMQSEKLSKKARTALDSGRYRLAELDASRALQIEPEDEEAAEILAEARKQRHQMEELLERAVQVVRAPLDDLKLAEAVAPPVSAAFHKTLLETLLVSTADDAPDPATRANQAPQTPPLERLAIRARLLHAADPNGPLADEAEYILALAQNELGSEAESWERLRALANERPDRSNMSRHAAALVGDPWQNTYGNFLRQKRRAEEKANARRLLGRFANGVHFAGLPTPIAYLVQAPAIVRTVVTAPMRLIFGRWDAGDDLLRVPAIAGYRYLSREPAGQHVREVADWLYDYETKRGDWGRALRLVDLQPVDPFERLMLVEKAARQRLDTAKSIDRRDWRTSILRGVAREYPDTDAGHEAGARLRDELEEVAPQRIRITRSFLQENPQVAGIGGLGLNPALLDDDVSNGELHPLGVTFLGGRVMEFALVPKSGDEDEEPVTRRERIHQDRLSRAVAMLDETVLLNDQLDDGAAMAPDAFRDHYLERARLGLVEEPDMRASAQSDYVYESLRERYGLVRGRDSLLPFSLVFQGSLFDLSLGAFPRWQQPRETPDSFLYK